MARFDLNLLGALDALLTERNVTRASERLCVTQPTMSGMLQRLRYQFNDQILVRNGRNLELTRLGQSLIDPVREALRNVDSLVTIASSFDPASSDCKFSIMASDYCAMVFLPRVIRRLEHEAPGIMLDIIPLSSPVERLANGELDFCISTDDRRLLSSETSCDFLHSQSLFADGFLGIAAKEHPIASTPTMEQYLSYPHIGVHMPGSLTTIEAATLRLHAPNYRAAYRVADFSLIPPMVAESQSIGIVQRRLATIAQRTFGLRTFVPPFVMPPINETLLWHERNTDCAPLKWLRGIICEEAERGFSSCDQDDLATRGNSPDSADLSPRLAHPGSLATA